jgi:hypothetical protein
LNLLEEVLAEHQDAGSSGEDGGVLSNDISSALLKTESSEVNPGGEDATPVPLAPVQQTTGSWSPSSSKWRLRGAASRRGGAARVASLSSALDYSLDTSVKR